MSRLIGINRAGSIWISAPEIARLAHQGLWYRVDFRRDFSDAERDSFVALATLNNLKFLPILLWNNPRPQGDAMWAQWKSYVQYVVRRYPQQLWWQMWNEPNNARVPNTYFHDNLDAWRGFLRRTSRFVKEVNPNARVVSGGIAAGGHGSKLYDDKWNSWFNVNDIVDRVAVHTYISDAGEAAKAINSARKVSTQPVWCTELGRKSTVDGDYNQAAWYRKVRGLTAETPLFWFDLQDVDGAFDGFGAFRRDWSAKPIWSNLT